MPWPTVPHQKPHEAGHGYGIERMVKEADGNKSQDQRIGLAPEPEILMEAIEDQDDKGQEEWNPIFQFRSATGPPGSAGVSPAYASRSL